MRPEDERFPRFPQIRPVTKAVIKAPYDGPLVVRLKNGKIGHLAITDSQGKALEWGEHIAAHAWQMRWACWINHWKGVGYLWIQTVPAAESLEPNLESILTAVLSASGNDVYQVRLNNGEVGYLGITGRRGKVFEWGEHVAIEVWNATGIACRDWWIDSGHLFRFTTAEEFRTQIKAFDQRDLTPSKNY